MNAEGRNHHHCNHNEVQKHDDRLTPGMLPKAPPASKPSAKQNTYPHDDFEDEDYIGAARSGRFKKCFCQLLVSTPTTTGFRSSSDKRLAWRRGQNSFWQLRAGVRWHIIAAQEHPQVVGTGGARETSTLPTPLMRGFRACIPQSCGFYSGTSADSLKRSGSPTRLLIGAAENTATLGGAKRLA
jgi:hypothetical protein